jgi:hypothetical protein
MSKILCSKHKPIFGSNFFFALTKFGQNRYDKKKFRAGKSDTTQHTTILLQRAPQAKALSALGHNTITN